MPTTIEGRLESVSMAVDAILVTGPSGAYSTRKTAPNSEIGTEMMRVSTSR